MLTITLLVCSILVEIAILALLRKRRLQQTLAPLSPVTLLASIVAIAILVVLPDLLILVSTMKFCTSHPIGISSLPFLLGILMLSAALAIGCSKQPEAPHEIHWQGPETGYTATTTLPPENADKPKGGL